MSFSFSDILSLAAFLFSLFTALSVALQKRVRFDVSSVFIRLLDSNVSQLHYALVSFSLGNSSSLPLLVNRIRLRTNNTKWFLPLQNPAFESKRTVDPLLWKRLEESHELASAPLLPVVVPAHSAQRISLVFPLRLFGDTQELLESLLALSSLPTHPYPDETPNEPTPEDIHNPLSLELTVHVSALERFLARFVPKTAFGKNRLSRAFVRCINLDADNFCLF